MAKRSPITLLKTLVADRSGATLVEFTLILMVLLTLTFGVAEFGYAGFQWANAEAATQRGVRVAATRSAAITIVDDCGVPTTLNAGQPCKDEAASYTWSCTCNAASAGAAVCSTDSAGACEAATLTRIVQEMQKSYPGLTANNVNVTFSGAGLGFQGLGRPVPIVTVELTGLTFEFIALDGLIGLPDQINMPAFRASLTAEDLQGA